MRGTLAPCALLILLTAACDLMPWAKKEALQTQGYQEIGDFIRSLKRGKTERAAELLSEEARVRWQIRLSLMSEKEKRDLLREIKADTFTVDEDINRFIIKGKKTAPTKAKIVREHGKRRVEF